VGHGGGEIGLTRQRVSLGLDYAPPVEICREIRFVMLKADGKKEVRAA